MAFKRPRPLSYGDRGQKIYSNGIPHDSPLDQKKKPLEQQNSYILELTSEDRFLPADTKGKESTGSTDCRINLKTTIRGIYGYRVLKFSFMNRFYSVQTGINDLLNVTWTTTPTTPNSSVNSGQIFLREGRYVFLPDPASWNNPLYLPPAVNLNDIKYADIANLSLYYPTDIRVELLRAGLGLIDRILTDRITNRLEIQFLGQSPTLNPELSTCIRLLGLSRTTSGNVWQTIYMPNVDGPCHVSLISSVLNDVGLLDPRGENDIFLNIAIHVPFDSRQLHEPSVPNFINFGTQYTWDHIPIRFVDGASGLTLKSNNLQWSLTIECFSLEANPFH